MGSKNGTRSRVQLTSSLNLYYQYTAVLTGILIVVCTGMHMGWPSPSLPLLLNKNSTIPTTESDGSWIIAMLFITQPFGCLTGSLIVDRIGRKPCILLGSPLIFVSWLIIAFASNVFMLELGRALAGYAGGIVFTALPIYIGEVANKKIRGLLGCSTTVASKLGIFVVNVIGLHFDIRMTALIAAAVAVLHFATFVWMPESPYLFLLRRNNRRAAASVKRSTIATDVEGEMSELSSLVKTNYEHSGKFQDLFTNRVNRRALGVILGLKAVQHFSGFHAVNFYCFTIFNEAKGAVTGGTATIIYLGTQLTMAALGSAIVDITGRRFLLIFSITGAGCALSVAGLYFYLKLKTSVDVSSFGFLPLITLLFYTSSYCIGVATIPVLMLGELFSVSVKAFAAGLSMSCSAVFTVVVTKLFQIIKDSYGMHVPFFIFALCCASGLIFIIHYVPETKGKSLKQIQLDWTSSNLNAGK